jgi:hypothetical protein
MATIAVFLALGGGAYAALKLPKNSVGPKQIKPNAVRSADVKNDKLTGADVREPTLAVVPEAAHAGTSDSANSAATADTLGGVGPDAFARADRIIVQRGTARWTASEEQTKPFMTKGPFTLTLNCRYDANTRATLLVTTTAANSRYTSSGDGVVLGPASPPQQLATVKINPGGPYEAAGGAPFSLSAPDGTYLAGHVSVSASETAATSVYECGGILSAITG